MGSYIKPRGSVFVTHTALFFQVTQLASYFEPLIVASVGLASKLHDHQQQMTILDQSKTLAESALQMLYAAKEGGGNPKVWIISIFFFIRLKSHELFFSTSDGDDGDFTFESVLYRQLSSVNITQILNCMTSGTIEIDFKLMLRSESEHQI